MCGGHCSWEGGYLKTLREEIIYAHRFSGFSPWLAGHCFWATKKQEVKIRVEGQSRTKLLTSWWPGIKQ